jgi:hypothetical protein
MYLVLGSATALKLLCWAVCAALQSRSDSMLALAEVRGVTAGVWISIGDGSCTRYTSYKQQEQQQQQQQHCRAGRTQCWHWLR